MVDILWYISCCVILGYDSDVEREKNIDYVTKTYANPIRTTDGIKPRQQEYEESETWVGPMRIFFMIQLVI